MNMKDKQLETEKYGIVRCKLGDIMAERGLSVAELARMCETLPVNIQRAANNEVWPSARLLARICTVLDVSISEMIEHAV
jgi:transcriptional regulator with XRE-family HTH domain